VYPDSGIIWLNYAHGSNKRIWIETTRRRQSLGGLPSALSSWCDRYGRLAGLHIVNTTGLAKHRCCIVGNRSSLFQVHVLASPNQTVFGLIDILHSVTLFVSTAPWMLAISSKMTLAVPRYARSRPQPSVPGTREAVLVIKRAFGS
jgi:hypothetical protein